MANRERIQEALDPDQLATVRELCRGYGLPFRRWPDHPACKSFRYLAAARVAERIEAERGLAETKALEAAAIRLGLSPDGLVRSRRRWRGAA